MKSNILKIKAFAILLTIAIFFSAFSLKDSEDKTFLETYKGTVWKYGDVKEGLTLYAQINRSESEPLELWMYNVIDGCYFYERYAESVSTEVLENNKNKVQIRIKESADEYGIFTLTIKGNDLTVELDSFKHGKLVKEEQFNLNKSKDNIDQLTVCDN